MRARKGWPEVVTQGASLRGRKTIEKSESLGWSGTGADLLGKQAWFAGLSLDSVILFPIRNCARSLRHIGKEINKSCLEKEINKSCSKKPPTNRPR